MSLSQWETYYRSGAVATGPVGLDGLYDLELQEAWQAFFDQLPADARLLDIGTGNGVLPLMALKAAQRRGEKWSIDATDLAQIDPVNSVSGGAHRYAGVRFHPGVANERLPFTAASFDGVSGHYALEYGNTSASLAEVARVLASGGHAQFVLHHAESVLMDSARHSMAECDLVFKQTRIYRKLHRLVSADQPSQDFLRNAQQELSAAIRQLRQALEQRRHDRPESGRILEIALDAARSLLAARTRTRPSLVGLEVDRAEEDLRAAWRRLNDLTRHAVDAAGFARVCREADSAGFEILKSEPIFHAATNLVGWQLSLRKR
ncbi:class I SAM-dependent methyltransferase [Aquimonas voraii]|uniref:Methyltransferase domain-containing protein n=1 Tax=Aquimonas voraii TaxID=265719 RepID=A0A1G6ZCJ3_9GAMM|nr:class I SAM-dependent methyltransferase [Aquimonas voraii]SDE00414.1 Methyltransferase domain-containing protein [Aquimonas voraii]